MISKIARFHLEGERNSFFTFLILNDFHGFDGSIQNMNKNTADNFRIILEIRQPANICLNSDFFWPRSPLLDKTTSKISSPVQ